jgi:nucleotide-binding universal stress UspA family protein
MALGGRMCAYHTVVVGTDGSGPSMRAIERAAWIAAAADAKLIIATAYVHHSDQVSYHHDEEARAEDILKDEAYQMRGDAPVYEMLHEARERAEAAGAKNVEVRAVAGGPVPVLVDLAEEVKADLLVVGNLGISTVKGRLLGSVPAAVTHRAKTDVLVVHTRD